MNKVSAYESKQPDANGIISWTEEENAIWSELITGQLQVISDKASQVYLDGLDKVSLAKNRIPQFHEIDPVLQATTGWQCEAVPCVIDFDHFFELLANKRFPVATFIRNRQDFHYVQEPDVFHEMFGHTIMLTNPAFANFTQMYGNYALNATKAERVWLARLYWFTVEFGLLKEAGETKIYGGGILSSPSETEYALSEIPEHLPFDILTILRTPYRIDMKQKAYFVLEDIEQLFELANIDIMAKVNEAREQGLLPSRFPPKNKIVA